MKLKEQIAVRVDGKLKGLVLAEVKSRRERGHGADGADVVRDALIEYFERKAQSLAKQAACIHWKLLGLLCVGSGLIGAVCAWVCN